MSGRIDDRVFASRRSKRDFGCINCDVLFLLLKKGIEQKSEFKSHSLRCACLLYLFDFAFGQRTCVVQDATDQRGLAMIDMTNKNDLELRLSI